MDTYTSYCAIQIVAMQLNLVLLLMLSFSVSVVIFLNKNIDVLKSFISNDLDPLTY